MYLLGMDEKENEDDIVMFSFKVPKKLRDSFHAAAKAENMDASNLLRQFMNKTIREVKGRDLEAFERALTKEQSRAIKNKSAKVERVERARSKGQLMEAPKIEKSSYDWEKAHQRLLDMNLEVDFATFIQILDDNPKEFSEDFRRKIFQAADIHFPEDQESKPNRVNGSAMK